MSLFKKNSNETAYVGGKKHFADVIKNTGSSELLVWRQPEEDFNNGSTLIVMPGEEAVFINGGVIEQIFTNGTYTLSTQNYPFISRLRNARTGGISVYNCVIYFVKKSLSIEIKWGTDSPIQVRDKKLGIATKLKARGSYKICVNNVGIFIMKLLGNNVAFQHPRDLDNYFFNEFQSKIRSVIAKAINSQEEELLGIDARLDELSMAITPFFQEILSEYGLKCVNFVVSAIDIDDSELRRKYDNIGMNMYEQERQGDVLAQNTLKQGQAQAQVKLQQGLVDTQILMAQGDAIAQNTLKQGQAETQVKLQQGLNDAQIMMAQGMAQKDIMDKMGNLGWSKQQAAEILKTLAENPAGGGLATTSAGLGMGMAMSAPFASLASQMISPLTNIDSNNVSNHNSAQSRFEEEVPNNSDPVKTLGKLKELLDAGLISEDEYNEKKKEILSRM